MPALRTPARVFAALYDKLNAGAERRNLLATVGDPGSIEVRDLQREEVPEAVDVLARGMRDNPLQVAAYGDDPARRLRCHAILCRSLFRAFPAQQPICALRDGTLMGVTGVFPVGTCQLGVTSWFMRRAARAGQL